MTESGGLRGRPSHGIERGPRRWSGLPAACLAVFAISCAPAVPAPSGPALPVALQGGPGGAPPAPGKGPAVEDPRSREVGRIRERVARLAEAMRGIRLDGKADDWSGFHWGASTVADPRTGKDFPLRLAIAPSDDRVHFCVDHGKDQASIFREWEYVYLYFDLRPGAWESLEVRLDGDSCRAWIWERDKSSPIRIPEGAVMVVDGACLEGTVLLDLLLDTGAGPAKEEWMDAGRTPVMIVSLALTERRKKGDETVRNRRGPVVASYRLSPDRFHPSWADPPPSGRGFARCRFFLDGKWYVFGGPEEWPTHEGVNAYDLVITDGRGLTFRGEAIRRNEDSHAWGAPVHAPTEGIVVVAEGGNEDQVPLGDAMRWKEVRRYRPNVLSVAGPIGWAFTHLQKGSISSAKGESLKAGEPVARVGNSASTGPHLHCEFWSGEDLVGTGLAGDVPGARLVLQDVVVGLNPGPDDPWEVRLPEWLVETGYYVRKADPPR